MGILTAAREKIDWLLPYGEVPMFGGTALTGLHAEVYGVNYLSGRDETAKYNTRNTMLLVEDGIIAEVEGDKLIEIYADHTETYKNDPAALLIDAREDYAKTGSFTGDREDKGVFEKPVGYKPPIVTLSDIKLPEFKLPELGIAKYIFLFVLLILALFALGYSGVGGIVEREHGRRR